MNFRTIIYILCVFLISGLTCDKRCRDCEIPPDGRFPHTGFTSVKTIDIDSFSVIIEVKFEMDSLDTLVSQGLYWTKSILPNNTDSVVFVDTGHTGYIVKIQNLQPKTKYLIRPFFQLKSGKRGEAQLEFETLQLNYFVGGIGPAGGIIFWMKDKKTGLEIGPEFTDSLFPWGCSGQPMTTGLSFGDGPSNTTNISPKCYSLINAAGFCRYGDFNKLPEWYLPSKNELDTMYKYLASRGLGKLRPEYYWSSSAYDDDNAILVSMKDGSSIKTDRWRYYRVRPIRKFELP
ncbi:MAG: DUF1566 domain-containing protein [Bacteroidetes bacterium]|nr:DUF1566 domain-containing protein [Bacteroidota bacterium]